MKITIIFAVLLFSLNSFASSLLYCEATRGTIVTANEEEGQFSEVRTVTGREERRSYPLAKVAHIVENDDSMVTSLVITDPVEGIIVVLIDGILFIRGESYGPGTCGLEM